MSQNVHDVYTTYLTSYNRIMNGESGSVIFPSLREKGKPGLATQEELLAVAIGMHDSRANLPPQSKKLLNKAIKESLD